LIFVDLAYDVFEANRILDDIVIARNFSRHGISKNKGFLQTP
jgi:hypothetical protein